MDKVSNSNTQIQSSAPTNRRPLLQLLPTLLRGLSGIILAVLPIILDYQSPRVTLTLHTDVSQSNQEYEAFISVSISTNQKSPSWKKRLIDIRK